MKCITDTKNIQQLYVCQMFRKMIFQSFIFWCAFVFKLVIIVDIWAFKLKFNNRWLAHILHDKSVEAYS